MTPTRRSLLAAAGAALVASCTTRSPRTAPTPATVDPDVALRAAAVTREMALVAGLDRALAALGGTPAAALLGQVRAEHLVHLQALDPAAAPAAAPPPAARTGASAATQQAYLRTLSARERAAASAHAAATATASGPLAALLAQVAASEASHAVVL